MWGKKRVATLQVNSTVRAKRRKKTIALVSSIGFGVGTVLLGLATIWLLSWQAFLQVTVH